MGEVVNLRALRKRRRRAEEEKAAAARRLAYGQSKAEQRRKAAETAQRERLLDGARRDPGKDPPGG